MQVDFEQVATLQLFLSATPVIQSILGLACYFGNLHEVLDIAIQKLVLLSVS